MTFLRIVQLISLGVRVGCAAVCLQGASAAASDPSSPPAGAGEGEPICALEIARRVQSHYEQIRDFEAHFEQVTKSVATDDCCNRQVAVCLAG